MENQVYNDALRYRMRTVVRVFSLMEHGVIGDEPEFQELRDCVKRNFDQWVELAGENWPDMDNLEAVLQLLPLAEALYGLASGVFTRSVPACVQNSMYEIVDYLKKQVPEGSVTVEPSRWFYSV